MRDVFLKSVFTWTCPECGAANQHCGARIKDPELLEDLQELAHDGELFEASEFVTIPEFVFCVKCEERSRVIGEAHE